MRTKYPLLKLFVALWLLFGYTHLQAHEDTLHTVSTSANVDFVSRYIWRGIEIGHAPGIQPALSATWKGFTLGSWGSYKLTGAGGQETDFYLSKSVGFVTVAVWDYWNFCDTTATDFFNYGNTTTAHLLEAQVLLSGGETLPFNFLASWFFYGADPSRSIYFELQKWLEIEFNSEVELLNMIRKGEFRLAITGSYLLSVEERFAPGTIVDMYCYIGLYLELSIKAKLNLMLKENDFPIIVEEDLGLNLKS
ncbi:MAG: TorF family putative porin [Bacteroidota bacterium]